MPRLDGADITPGLPAPRTLIQRAAYPAMGEAPPDFPLPGDVFETALDCS